MGLKVGDMVGVVFVVVLFGLLAKTGQLNTLFDALQPNIDLFKKPIGEWTLNQILPVGFILAVVYAAWTR